MDIGRTGQRMPSILFVEDEPVTAKLIVKALKRDFNEIYIAFNGQEGLQLFINNRPDIVLTDILMPKMNGIELVAQIKQINSNTPIIMMSAFSEEHYLDEAKKLGVEYYLMKPIDFDELYILFDKIKANIQ
jgi:YesN/AraC family two-component response regulator